MNILERHELTMDTWMVAHIFGENGEVTREIETVHSVTVHIQEDIPGLPFALLNITGPEVTQVLKALEEIQQRIRGLFCSNLKLEEPLLPH